MASEEGEKETWSGKKQLIIKVDAPPLLTFWVFNAIASGSSHRLNYCCFTQKHFLSFQPQGKAPLKVTPFPNKAHKIYSWAYEKVKP